MNCFALLQKHYIFGAEIQMNYVDVFYIPTTKNLKTRHCFVRGCQSKGNATAHHNKIKNTECQKKPFTLI